MSKLKNTKIQEVLKKTLDLPQYTGENNAWETPGPTASKPRVKMWPREVPVKCVIWEPTRQGKGNTAEHGQRWTSPEVEYWVASLPVGVLQSHLPHTTDQKRAKKQIWGPLLQQLRSRPHPWQGSDNQRVCLICPFIHQFGNHIYDLTSSG